MKKIKTKSRTKKQFLKRQRKIRELEIFIILQLLLVFVSGYLVYTFMSNMEKKIYSTTYPEDIIQPIIKFDEVKKVDEEQGSKIDEIEDKVLAPVSIPNLIEVECQKAGLKDWEIERFKKIAWCESKYNPNAQNSISSAAGIMQIIRGTWGANSDLPFDQYKYNATENIKTGITIYQRSGFSPWECNNLI